jgi:hypothetical protein
VWRESHCVTNAKGDKLFLLGDISIIRMFRAVELSAFHKRTPQDHPQCCDQPYRVIEYGPDMVADMESVSELTALMYETYQEALEAERHKDDIPRTRMRVRSSMK